MPSTPVRLIAALGSGALTMALVAAPVSPAAGAPRTTEKEPVAVGSGGAVATVDAEATRVGLEVLRKGGNAVDAAVAAAATLGVTEPYSAGIGGGGFFVYFDAATGDVHTIDGRETAPQAMQEDAFVEDGTPIPFSDAVTSGLSVGVPGTPETWDVALDQWGTISLRQALRGATQGGGHRFPYPRPARPPRPPRPGGPDAPPPRPGDKEPPRPRPGPAGGA